MIRAGALITTVLAAAGLGAAQSALAAKKDAVSCAKKNVPGGEWRTYGHDYSNSRFQPEEEEIGPSDATLLTPAWTFSTQDSGGDGDITGTPIVAYGCVYTGTNGGYVFALNADTGEVVWKREVPYGGNIFGSALATKNRVFVIVNRTNPAEDCAKGQPCVGPYAMAVDRRTGKIDWTSKVLDRQPGADTYGSPVVFNGVMMAGVSGGIAELSSEAEHRDEFQGSLNFIDARTGKILKKTWTIHPPRKPDDDFAGAGVWGTPAVDRKREVAYVGTANPYVTSVQHPHSDAILKFDVDPKSKRFGKILGHAEGTPEEYLDLLTESPCIDFPGNIPPYPTGLGSCGDLDLDFGASPNLIREQGGKLLVGGGQKSGVYHLYDAKTMENEWSRVVGLPGYFGGILGSTAYDGRAIYGPVTIPGYAWSLSPNGGYRWIAPIGDGLHWGPPVAVANGVVYTVDLLGTLNAFDAKTGLILNKRPLLLGGTNNPVSLSWAGVSVARNTVYASVGILGLPQGYIVAYKPGDVGDLVGDIGETLGGLGGGGGGGGGSTGASGGATILAGPGATSSGYLTSNISVQPGQPVNFANLDIALHDVTASELVKKRPIFQSELIGLGETGPVEGTENVQSGRSYGFFCSIHPGMRGTINVR